MAWLSRNMLLEWSMKWIIVVFWRFEEIIKCCPIFTSPVRIKIISFIGCSLLATRVSYCLSKEASIKFHRASHWVRPTNVVVILSKLWNSHRQKGEMFLLSLTRHLTALKCQFSQFIHSITITQLATSDPRIILSNHSVPVRDSSPI
jgi:hypothetical protein